MMDNPRLRAIDQGRQQLLYLHFDETDLAKLPTKAALRGRVEESSLKEK